ncbi:MAG: hypothetical protein V2J16_00405 [Thermoleophilia bacterium]|jgi:hypothetical protein|nr:hypothetical protein [Thermoleophilia bacterium]
MEHRSTTSLGEARVAPAGRFGSRVALIVTGLTVVSFALALTALPDKVPYPFTDAVIAEQWPGDYLWIYPAMVLMLAFVALVAAVHEWAPADRKVWSLLALCVATVAAAVLLVDYYLQVTVMQVSLEKGQLDGWAMLTMYNPNGVFIALEELGYLLMSLVFLCLAPVYARKTRLERAIRWLFTLSVASSVVALVVVSAVRGIDRGDTFEIAVISIVWLTLIAAGPLLSLAFRRADSQDR